MVHAQSQSALPRSSLDRLVAIEPGFVILAFLGQRGDDALARNAVEQVLHPIIGDADIFDEALAKLSADKLVTITRAGRCRIAPVGRAEVEDVLGTLSGRNWADVVGRALAPLALGLDPRDPPTRRYLSRKENLDCAVLACVYGLRTSSRLPTRSEVRFLFLRALLSVRLPECEPAFTEMTMQNTLRDPVSRALMLGAAGLQRGGLRDAEGALLRKALDVRGEPANGIAEALVRNAVGKCAARPLPRIQLPPLTLVAPKEPVQAAADKSGLADFAATVRDLAKAQKTPFAGRVAIAQVYDAGMQRGLDFGTLESFKQRIAEACRAGLLDLERYDIAGPMDAALRERSRTVFGRDVRHFIVNEWI